MSMRGRRLEKAHWGRDKGLWGEGKPVSLPPQKKFYTCSEMPVPKGARLVGMMPCMAETA